MTFEQWAQDKKHMTPQTREAMELVWDIFTEAAVPGSTIAYALDMMLGAIDLDPVD